MYSTLTKHPTSKDGPITPEMERHLMEMGIISSTPLEEIEAVVDPRLKCLAKGYFDDPRDPVTGEVNH